MASVLIVKLIKLGFGVAVERGIGAAANFDDDAYVAAGARLVDTATELLGVRYRLQVRPPTAASRGAEAGSTLIGFIGRRRTPS
ncbi:MAG: hypothetical protein R3E65_06490 [Steroidobacteraceae bacterium]